MGVCMHKYVNTAFVVWLGCLCVYGFKADCFILNEQLGAYSMLSLLLSAPISCF